MENAQPHANGQQLLVVDDEPLFAEFLREKFERLGYSVVTTRDAGDALAFARHLEAPLVVLLDLMLPRVSGHQLLRELARCPHAADIRVVLVSAHHTVGTVAAQHPMVVGRAQKPIDLAELTRMVDVAAHTLTHNPSPHASGP
jgi:CheY-like chemotaxis protein